MWYNDINEVISLLNYEKLSENIAERIKNDRVNNTLPQVAFCEDVVVR